MSINGWGVLSYGLNVLAIYFMVRFHEIYHHRMENAQKIWLLTPLGIDLGSLLFFNISFSFFFIFPLYGAFHILYQFQNYSKPEIGRQSQKIQPSLLKLLFWMSWITLGMFNTLGIIAQQNFITYIYFSWEVVDQFFPIIGIFEVAGAILLFFLFIGLKMKFKTTLPINLSQYSILLAILGMFTGILYGLYVMLHPLVSNLALSSRLSLNTILSGIVCGISLLYFLMHYIYLRIRSNRQIKHELQEPPASNIEFQLSEDFIIPNSQSKAKQASETKITNELQELPELCPTCHRHLNKWGMCRYCQKKYCPHCLNWQSMAHSKCECGYTFPVETLRIRTLIPQTRRRIPLNPITEEDNHTSTIKSDNIEISSKGLRICPVCSVIGWKKDICQCGYNYITKKMEKPSSQQQPKKRKN